MSNNIGIGWVLGRDNFENYRTNLFAADRMEARQDLFERITLPSLVNQTKCPSSDWLTVFVMVSEEMPADYRQRLIDLVAAYDWIRVVALPVSETNLDVPVAAVLRDEPGELTYVTIRLDDDDALSADYFEQLFAYVTPQFDGFGVSFGRGVAGLMEDGKFVSFRDYYLPKLGLGLALVKHKAENEPHEFESVYGLGNHRWVDQQAPLILDSRRYSFMRTVHRYADTQKVKAIDRYLKMRPMSLAEVATIFRIEQVG